MRLRFATLLPLFALVLWVVLVPTPTAFAYFRLLQLSHGAAAVRLAVGNFTVILPRHRFLIFSVEGVGLREWPVIESVYIPGMLGEILTSLPISWPESWIPAGLTFHAWRALSWPFFSLPAWWFAGRGLDALLGWRRLRWGTLLTGTLLSAAFLLLLVGMCFCLSASDRAGTAFIDCGFGLWTLLFAAFPAAWLRRAFASKLSEPPSAIALP